METELRMLEEGPQVNIHPDGLKATLKKIVNGKTPNLDGIHGFGVREKIYYSLIRRVIFPVEQKGCRKRTRSTVELLYMDQHILNENKTKQKI